MTAAAFGASKGFEDRAARVRARTGRPGGPGASRASVARQGARRAGLTVALAFLIAGAGAVAAMGGL